MCFAKGKSQSPLAAPKATKKGFFFWLVNRDNHLERVFLFLFPDPMMVLLRDFLRFPPELRFPLGRALLPDLDFLAFFLLAVATVLALPTLALRVPAFFAMFNKKTS